jgi:hypothetical protein
MPAQRSSRNVTDEPSLPAEYALVSPEGRDDPRWLIMTFLHDVRNHVLYPARMDESRCPRLSWQYSLQGVTIRWLVMLEPPNDSSSDSCSSGGCGSPDSAK